ncbi:15755_t:CDS:2, partial [Gigaspora margarita]
LNNCSNQVQMDNNIYINEIDEIDESSNNDRLIETQNWDVRRFKSHHHYHTKWIETLKILHTMISSLGLLKENYLLIKDNRSNVEIPIMMLEFNDQENERDSALVIGNYKLNIDEFIAPEKASTLRLYPYLQPGYQICSPHYTVIVENQLPELISAPAQAFIPTLPVKPSIEKNFDKDLDDDKQEDIEEDNNNLEETEIDQLNRQESELLR